MAPDGDPKASATPLDREARLALLSQLPWGRTFRKLTNRACRWGLIGADAKDLAQDTITRFLRSQGAGWDPVADPTAFRCLLRKMDNRLGTLREQERLRQEIAPTEVDTEKAEEAPPDSDRGEASAVLNEAALRNLERLRTRLRGFPITLRLLELSIAEGQQKPSVAAEKLGVTVEQIYIAEAQLLRHARRLRGDGSDPDVRAELASRGKAENVS